MQTCLRWHLVSFLEMRMDRVGGNFLEFVAKLHPSMNSGDVTVITDQDKGQMNAIAKWIPAAGHFHCSHHR